MFTREEQINFYVDMPVSVADHTLTKTKSEVIRAVALPSFVRIDLEDREGKLLEITTADQRADAIPSQWAALLVTNESHGLVMERFGTGDNQKARTDKRNMNQILQNIAARHSTHTFESYGGHIVERARRAAQGVFAVIELRNIPSEQELVSYATLAFPKALICYPSKRTASKEPYEGVRTVGEARQMALSAFACIPLSIEDIERPGE